MKKILIVFTLILSTQLFQNVLAQSKTAQVNTKALMDTLPSRKKALGEIQEVTKRGEAELAEMEKQFKKAYDDYLAAKPNQSQQVNQYEESKLQKMQQDFQKREQELNTMIQNMTIEMNDKTYKIIQEATKTIAVKKGFQFVLEETNAIYAGGTNLTNDIITELLRLDALAMTQ